MNNGKGDFFAPGNWDLSKASSGEAFPFNFATAFSGISPNSLNFFHYFGS